MLHERIGRSLYRDTFWPPNPTFKAQKNGQVELARREGRLFLILNTAVDQKNTKKISCHRNFKKRAS